MNNTPDQTITNLQHAVRSKIEDVKLDDGQLQKLNQLLKQNVVEEQQTVQKPERPYSFFVGVAAILLLTVSLWLGTYYSSHTHRDDLLHNIALEAVNNHLKKKPLEIEDSRLDSVLAYFDQLDFAPVAQPITQSLLTSKPSISLVGGRYCSIQGIDAAQLRFTAEDGKLTTLYQGVLPTAQLALIPNIDEGAKTVNIVLKGIQTTIWRSSGLVMVETRALQ